MRKRSMRIAIIVLAAAAAFIGGWILMYPSPGDPKNIKYVLWKAGLYPSYPVVTSAMVGDCGSDKLVVGKTKAQLQEKFGLLTSLADASPYLVWVYQTSSWKGRDVLFIVGDSSWMVVFDGDKAVDLVLCKG